MSELSTELNGNHPSHYDTENVELFSLETVNGLLNFFLMTPKELPSLVRSASQNIKFYPCGSVNRKDLYVFLHISKGLVNSLLLTRARGEQVERAP